MKFRIPKRVRQVLKILFLLAILGAVGFGVWFAWILRKADDIDDDPYFTRDYDLTIEKTTPEGVEYTVNNSLATFKLDVIVQDKHSAKLFRDYASALKYCSSEDLPVIPSVQLVHGKAKQFNDRLCAALELAIQDGIAETKIPGKRTVLQRLLSELMKVRRDLPEDNLLHIDSAIVYVATALQLGGVTPEISPELVSKVNSEAESFLAAPIQSRPLGFWQENESLRNIFVQDRFLMRGLSLRDNPGACFILASVISRDSQLSEEFTRFREFDSKLTNPPRYVQQGEILSPSAQCPSFADLAALLSADLKPAEILEPARLDQLRAGSLKKFGSDAGFALIAYSQSKEYDLLLKGQFTGRELTLELIIDAIKTGVLSLEPKPDSGWYDYQWYALETLLLPERARESPKLILTEAYKKRLKTAFKSMITKERETHIKHLPVITLGMSMEEEEPVQVKIGPEFSTEPTATVYLRTARAYRFLQNALGAVLGEKSLETLSASQSEINLNTELREMSLLMYGIYDRISTELGQTPVYLPDEMGPDDIAAAKKIAADWFGNIQTDSDLAHDARVCVPIFNYPGGPVRYWATGGIRLERVRYEYISKPDVYGVDPIFVPTFYYLPTDISLEFERQSATPLTRQEFRNLCDSCTGETELRKLLRATSDFSGRIGPIMIAVFSLIAAAVVAIIFMKRFSLSFRKLVKMAFTLLALFLVILGLRLYFSTSYRIKFIVRHIASRNTGLAMICEAKFFYPDSQFRKPPSRVICPLMELLADDDPQVRYLAMSYLLERSRGSIGNAGKQTGINMEPLLRSAVDDPVSEVAQGALMLLGDFKNDENLKCLREKLKTHRSNDLICRGALIGLACMGDVRALDDILPFTEDPRLMVRDAAINFLGNCNDLRAVQRIVELITSEDLSSAASALCAVKYSTWQDKDKTEASKMIDPALLKAVKNVSCPANRRCVMADTIIDVPTRVRAYESILLGPSADKYKTIEDCQIHAADCLGSLGPDAVSAVPALRKILDNKDTAEKVCVRVEMALDRIQPEAD